MASWDLYRGSITGTESEHSEDAADFGGILRVSGESQSNLKVEMFESAE